VAGPEETLEWFLEQSGRRRTAPIHKGFVQRGKRGQAQAGPLAAFVRARRELALDLYLLCLLAATSEPYNVARSAATWTRALGLASAGSASTLISKQWRWLEDAKLIKRTGYQGPWREITLLAEDGSGAPYRPTLLGGTYLQLSFKYWTENWRGLLDLSEKTVLLIALSLGDDFILPHQRAPAWYGISPDTAARGLGGLKEKKLLYERILQKAAPDAPVGFTRQHHYTLMPPFGPKGVKSAAARGVEIWNSGGLPPGTPRRRRR
jgi:hypothetical protein